MTSITVQYIQLKKSEGECYLFKCTSESYTFQYYHKLGTNVIKNGELVCDAVYLNPLANFKQWYNSYEN